MTGLVMGRPADAPDLLSPSPECFSSPFPAAEFLKGVILIFPIHPTPPPIKGSKRISASSGGNISKFLTHFYIQAICLRKQLGLSFQWPDSK